MVKSDMFSQILFCVKISFLVIKLSLMVKNTCLQTYSNTLVTNKFLWQKLIIVVVFHGPCLFFERKKK